MTDALCRDAKDTDHLWIEMPDGVRLAARLWSPAGTRPVPAILEYIPYRKADMVRARDERNHPFLAAHGYACIRVDMRGSGDSEGHMPDMYAQTELDDARHVIDWVAAQPWCDGSVGMFGTSWGGTAALQASVGSPGPLKAVVAVCATHDRYTDDIHHMGGCVLTDSVEWGTTLPAILASPPTPNAGEDWQRLWRDRIDALSYPLAAWLREDGRSDYWRHGSVIHSADMLDVPILAIGGWSDRYSNSVMSLAQARPDLVWGIVGPWGHHYPDQAHPGPGIGFQQVALAWWDAWLKDRQAPDWPRLRVWMREHEPQTDAINLRRGCWVQAESVEQQTSRQVLHFSETGLSDTPVQGAWAIPQDLLVGGQSGDTGYFGRFGGLPLDQQADDNRSLVFETEPLAQDLILFGTPTAELTLSPGQPDGQVVVRLNDVSPDGTSARICYGVRNLALGDALGQPATDRKFSVPLHSTAYRISKGHRLRIALSASYWPLIWPVRSAGPLTLAVGKITLPVSSDAPKSLEAGFPAHADLPARKSYEVLSSPRLCRWCHEENGTHITGWHQPYTALRFTGTGTTFGFETRAEHRIDPSDPSTACTSVSHRMLFERVEGTAVITSDVSVRSTSTGLAVDATLRAEWNNQPFGSRNWTFTVPRHKLS